jgi:biopolymer transport protein ExbB
MGQPAAPGRTRLLAILAALLAAVLLLTFSDRLTPAARAQDKDAAEKKDEAAPPKKDDAKTTPAPPKKKESKNLFFHIVESAGIVFGPLLLVISIGLVWLIVLLFMDLRLSSAIPPGFVDDFTDTVNKRKFKEAYDMTRDDPSFLGRVLAAGMSRLQYGLEEAREAAHNTVESIKTGKKSLVTYLATIGTLGPLLGLVGTVFGMILAFMDLAGGGEMNTGNIAAAISHALVVTLLGIAVSVPAIFFYAFFTGRLSRVAIETSNMADDLLTQMYHNSKKPTAASAPAPTVAPVPAVEPIPVADNRPAIRQKTP